MVLAHIKGIQKHLRQQLFCEIDVTHEDFNQKSQVKLCEAHHLILMEHHNDFAKSIDVEANIVSLCVGCHKKTHQATYSVTEPLIEKLYEYRIDRLKTVIY